VEEFSPYAIKRKVNEVQVMYPIALGEGVEVAIDQREDNGASFTYIFRDVVTYYLVISCDQERRMTVRAGNGVGAFFKIKDATTLGTFSGNEDSGGH
jgi:hypothetical protein